MTDATELKLYAFQPNGHGEASAFVMAYTEEQARQRVIAEAENCYMDMDGFDTDYYDVSVWEVGGVVFNGND